MKNIHLGHFLGLSAIVLAVAAAFFSVTGLGQLFAGAYLAVIIMASALEFSKIIIATFLHKYWGEISKLLKTYLTIALVILVSITSAGIYGFLSSAYQQTATELERHDSTLGLVDSKIMLVKNKVDNNNQLIESKLDRYNKLMDLREKQEVRLDSMINRRYFSNANLTRDEISKANSEMLNIQLTVDELNSLNNKLNDSIGKFELDKLELKSNSKVAGEVGPLKYMSELTGKSMDVIVNYFTLLLIFVFDPLAICLVMATNWAFDRRRNGRKEDTIESEEVEVEVKEPTPKPETPKPEVKTPKKHKITPVTYDVNVLSDEKPEDSYNEGEMSPDVTEIPEPVDVIDVEEVKPETPEPVDVMDIDVIDAEEVKPEIPEPKETHQITMDDIKKMAPFTQGDRGFSTKIPEPSTQERRIGSNKILKDGNQAVYKRKDGNQ